MYYLTNNSQPNPSQPNPFLVKEKDDFTLIVIFMNLVSLTTIAYRFHHHKPTTPATNLPPPPPPKLPIISHLHLISDMPHKSLTRLSDQYGPILYLKLGHVPTIVISSALIAQLILKTHDHIFCNRPHLVSAHYLLFNCSDVTFSPYWPVLARSPKNMCHELLSPKRVNSFQLIRNEEVARWIQTVSTRCGLEVDVIELFFRLANDVLCRVAFGKRFFREDSGDDLLRILSETQVLFAGFCFGGFYPDWEWVNLVSGSKRRMLKNLKELREVCDNIINDHIMKKGELTANSSEDFVDVLLHVQGQDDLEVPITDDNLKALVL